MVIFWEPNVSVWIFVWFWNPELSFCLAGECLGAWRSWSPLALSAHNTTASLEMVWQGHLHWVEIYQNLKLVWQHIWPLRKKDPLGWKWLPWSPSTRQWLGCRTPYQGWETLRPPSSRCSGLQGFFLGDKLPWDSTIILSYMVTWWAGK